jgi:ATP/maltotriose-dependent transcriptional regulator MalT
LDRAAQWAERVLALATGPDSRGFATFARTHYAALLIWRGRWVEAERELDRVLLDAAGRPMSAAVAMVLRCTLRRRQGRLDEAATELAACEREPFRHAVRHLVLASRAALELDRGHAQEAADIAERYLRAVSASDVVERTDALQTLVPARLALGELDAADAAAAQLEAVAQAVPTDAIRATAAVARAAVLRAQDCLEPALERLEAALTLFERVGMGYESVASRIAIAELLLELGRVDRARVVTETAAAGATELGARTELAKAHALLRRVRPDTGSAAGDLTSREIEIVRLIAGGLTNAEIADRLVLSRRTVERHTSNIYLKLGISGAAARTLAAAHARHRGLLAGDR